MKVHADKIFLALYEPINVKCTSDQETEYQGVNNNFVLR